MHATRTKCIALQHVSGSVVSFFALAPSGAGSRTGNEGLNRADKRDVLLRWRCLHGTTGIIQGFRARFRPTLARTFARARARACTCRRRSASEQKRRRTYIHTYAALRRDCMRARALCNFERCFNEGNDTGARRLLIHVRGNPNIRCNCTPLRTRGVSSTPSSLGAVVLRSDDSSSIRGTFI